MQTLALLALGQFLVPRMLESFKRPALPGPGMPGAQGALDIEAHIDLPNRMAIEKALVAAPLPVLANFELELRRHNLPKAAELIRQRALQLQMAENVAKAQAEQAQAQSEAIRKGIADEMARLAASVQTVAQAVPQVVPNIPNAPNAAPFAKAENLPGPAIPPATATPSELELNALVLERAKKMPTMQPVEPVSNGRSAVMVAAPSVEPEKQVGHAS